MSMKRRDFAKLAGLGAAGALLPLLRGGSARAGGPVIPKRIVFVYCNEGFIEGVESEMQPLPGMPTYDSTRFALSQALAPLAAHQSDMILFENLDMVSQSVDPTAPSNAHYAGETHALTAANRFDGSLPGTTSIDQWIANEINRGGPVTALRSLEVFCDAGMAYNDGWGGARRIASSSGPGALVDALGRPDEVFDRCFPAGSGEPVDATLLSRQARLFDFLRGESSAVSARLSATERTKIDEHMALLSDLEARRRLLIAGSDRRAFWPDRSLVTPADGIDWSYNADRASVWYDRYQLAVPIVLDTVAAALHADVTRVATIALNAPPPEGEGYVPGRFGDTDFHDLTHKTNGSDVLAAMNPEARATIVRNIHGTLDQVNHLVERLAGLTEVDGSRLLDHTLVVFTSQIGYGSHSCVKLPWFTVGNIDGYFRTGRLIQFPRVGSEWRTRYSREDGTAVDVLGDGRSHGDLFVSCANAMGLTDVTSFGSVSTGPIAEMR